jgi:multiple sugar transport system substrate-binding protein
MHAKFIIRIAFSFHPISNASTFLRAEESSAATGGAPVDARQTAEGMMKKPMISWLGTFTAALTLCAYGPAHAADTKTITVSTVGGNQAIEGLLPDFEKQTGIHVNLQILPYPQLRQRSMAAFVSGSVDSDVYWEDIIWLGEWAKNNYVRPLDDLIKRDFTQSDIDDFLPGAWNAQSKWDGKIWTMPYGAYYFLNYYRTDLFDKANLKIPVTLADVDSAAAALDKPGARQYGIASCYQRGTAISSWFLATYAGAGGHFFKNSPDDLTPTLDSPLALDVLKHYIAWMKSSPPSVATYNWDDQTVAMQTGRIAMAPTFSINATEFAKPSQSSVAGHVGYTVMPRENASDAPVIPYGGWGVGIAAKSTKIEESWAFIKWVTGTEVQKELAKSNGTPVRFSALEDPELQKMYPWVKLVIEAEKSGQVYPDYRPRYPFYPQVEEELGKQLNLAALGQIKPEDALTTANENVKRIIAEAGYQLPGAK